MALLRFPGTEAVLVVFHDDAAAAELYALHFQPEALVVARFALEADAAPGAQHALPGKRVAGPAKNLNHLPVVERVAGGGGHLTVGGDLAARDLADSLPDGRVALLGGPRPKQFRRLSQCGACFFCLGAASGPEPYSLR